MTALKELASVLRSKNSGPFAITLDILFNDPAHFDRVIQSGRITRESVARLYQMPPENITDFAVFEAALGIKITYLRAVPSGTTGDRDVYGAQQHAPLLDLMIP